jgi:CHASE3 domain sensor protein
LLAQRDWIEHTYQVMSTLEMTLQLVTDAETGQRGYILTGDKTYLEPYSRAVKQVHVLPDRIRNLVTDSRVQLVRVDELEHVLDAKLEELARTLRIKEEKGSDLARENILRNDGRESMDKIRTLIAQMRQAEAELLVQRTNRASRTERMMLAVTIALTILSIAARIALYFLRERVTGMTRS